jgi:hypothetical protein
MEYTFLATAAFGLEGVAANELKRMNIPARAENGGARFQGTLMDAFRANLYLRTADRVLMVLAEKKTETFEELFQLVGSIAWERLIPRDGKVHVSGKCVRSRLMSVRDCQAVSKNLDTVRAFIKSIPNASFWERPCNCKGETSNRFPKQCKRISKSDEKPNRWICQTRGAFSNAPRGILRAS